MKNSQFLILFLIFSMVSFWSCSEDSLSQEGDDRTTTRVEKKNPNKPGKDSAQDVYSATYDGSVVQSEEGFYRKTINNRNYSVLSDDQRDCNSFAMTVDETNYGINDLLAMIGMAPCYTDDDFCSPYHEVRQYDKRKAPEKVGAHFIFYDFFNSSNQLRFTMFGKIVEENDDEEYSIYPLTINDVVEIEFDRWKLTGDGICLQEGGIFFNDEEPGETTSDGNHISMGDFVGSIDLPNQTMTIRRYGEGLCPVDDCGFEFP